MASPSTNIPTPSPIADPVVGKAPAISTPPTQADAWDVNARALIKWLAEQKAAGIASGELDPKTGWPTSQALVGAAQKYGNSLLGSTEAPGGPKLPESLIPKPMSSGVKAAFDRFNSGVLSPESTAYHARRTSPEGLAYDKELRAKREAHTRAFAKEAYMQNLLERMREPGITDTGLFRLQSRFQKARQDFEAAVVAAKSIGINYPEDKFPVDERITLPHGAFPGDEKYAKPSFAPEGYPFNFQEHDYHDPANWLPETPKAEPK